MTATWICQDCGHRYGTQPASLPTWHFGRCDYCGDVYTPVTEARDYGHPELPED